MNFAIETSCVMNWFFICFVIHLFKQKAYDKYLLRTSTSGFLQGNIVKRILIYIQWVKLTYLTKQIEHVKYIN